jgi:hypothetical protein
MYDEIQKQDGKSGSTFICMLLDPDRVINCTLIWKKGQIKLTFPVMYFPVFPPDPHVFGPPGSGSISHRYGSASGSGSFNHKAKIVRKTLISTVLWLLFGFCLKKIM